MKHGLDCALADNAGELFIIITVCHTPVTKIMLLKQSSGIFDNLIGYFYFERAWPSPFYFVMITDPLLFYNTILKCQYLEICG